MNSIDLYGKSAKALNSKLEKLKLNIMKKLAILACLAFMSSMVYGGSQFVSSLIKNNLIDEYYLFIY